MRLLIIIIILNLNTLLSQNAEMYFIVSSSKDLVTNTKFKNYLSTQDSTKITLLCRLNKDNILEVVDTLNYAYNKKTFIEVIRHFEEYGVVFIRELENFYPFIEDNPKSISLNRYFTVIDYSSGEIKIRKARFDSLSNQNCQLLNGNAYDDDHSLLYTFSFCKEQIPYERNVIDKFLNVHELKESIFLKRSYAGGSSGFFYRNNSGIPFIDGNLSSTYYKGSEKRHINIFQFGRGSFDDEKYSGIEFLLRSPNHSYEIFFKRQFGGARDSLCTYYLYEKRKQIVDSVIMTESIMGMNIYDDKFGYGTLGVNGKYNPPNDTSDLKSRYTEVFGLQPDLRYQTGKFFIWDLEENRLKVFDFSDLDVELLSIFDDWVYYRHFDEIRRFEIGVMRTDTNDFKPELVFKDVDKVPNVHHVFWLYRD
ncbi:MAG: hypothetical protein NXI08_16595 [bacterium]|nr:hypothetical protein [bacterium]